MGEGRSIRRKAVRSVSGFTLIEIMIVVLIIGILLAIAVPNFVRARDTSRQKGCVNNLRKIQWAKDAYMMDKNLPPYHPFLADGSEFAGAGKFLSKMPACPSGGDYTVNNGDVDPECSADVPGFEHTIYAL